MRTVRTHTDAWTYYEFGARSFRDQIRAAVIDQLDQSSDGDAVALELSKETASSALPVITVGPHRISLTTESDDAQSICDMTRILFARYGNEDAVAVTYISEHPKLLAKLRDIFTALLADRISYRFFHAVEREARIPTAAEIAQGIYPPSPDR